MPKTAGIVLVGNEILSGKIADANAAYLCRELRILGVDVDEVVKKVVATIAVERAKQAQKNTTDWRRYMEAEGGIVILPSSVTQLGRKDSKR